MNEGTPVMDVNSTKLTLNAFDLWKEWPDAKDWRLPELSLDTYALLSQLDYDDGSDLVRVSNAEVLSYEGLESDDFSSCLSEVYRIARVFKRREWGVLLFTFDGPHSPFEGKVAIGPDIRPLFEGDAKEVFTEAVVVYLGPQLEKGPNADYGPVLFPLRYPYTAPGSWEPQRWAL